MTIEAQAGEWVGTFFERVKEELKTSDDFYQTVRFNDVSIKISWDSNVDDLLTIYDLKCQLNRLGGNK
jgi:hypothetical protein